MNHRRRFVIVSALISALFISIAGAGPADSPYGVCAHLAGHEFDTHAKALTLMRETGIGWVRADFSWSSLQPRRDAWNEQNLEGFWKDPEPANYLLLLQRKAGDYTCTAAAIYDFNSDWNGTGVTAHSITHSGSTPLFPGRGD